MLEWKSGPRRVKRSFVFLQSSVPSMAGKLTDILLSAWWSTG